MARGQIAPPPRWLPAGSHVPHIGQKRLNLSPDDRPARLKERAIVYTATLQFLADKGYVTYGSQAGSEADRHYASVRLTSKGLATLTRTPEALSQVGRSGPGVGSHGAADKAANLGE